MILCPTCHHQETIGALFCSECAGHLVSNHENASIHDALSLYIIDHDQVLDLPRMDSFTLGRINGGQSIIPDVDLSSFNAFNLGVSRLHATIKIGTEITITDLESSNGTFINGVRVEPHIPHSLAHGDLLTLGKMDFQIRIRY